MGTLLRAVFAFAVTIAVADPQGFASAFGTPRLQAVKAELAATHPGTRLQFMLESGLKDLPREQRFGR